MLSDVVCHTLGTESGMATVHRDTKALTGMAESKIGGALTAIATGDAQLATRMFAGDDVDGASQGTLARRHAARALDNLNPLDRRQRHRT